MAQISTLLSVRNPIVLSFTSSSGFGSTSRGHRDSLGVFCLVLSLVGAGRRGLACFMDDPTSDIWCQTYR